MSGKRNFQTEVPKFGLGSTEKQMWETLQKVLFLRPNVRNSFIFINVLLIFVAIGNGSLMTEISFLKYYRFYILS